ncbi:MAG TPA: hypothetical protein PLQ13_14930, partial [Candidatus Krumholzibacteria bacterium]|nr:hypothetical protein [Candidatus Krumholzibacteria bacterium]
MTSKRNLPVAILAVALVLMAAGALAADKEPGYVDLEWIPIPAGADEVTDIDLSPMLMSVAKDARENGDDALLQALAMVRSLRVKEFSVDPGMDGEIQATIDKL